MILVCKRTDSYTTPFDPNLSDVEDKRPILAAMDISRADSEIHVRKFIENVVKPIFEVWCSHFAFYVLFVLLVPD